MCLRLTSAQTTLHHLLQFASIIQASNAIAFCLHLKILLMKANMILSLDYNKSKDKPNERAKEWYLNGHWTQCIGAGFHRCQGHTMQCRGLYHMSKHLKTDLLKRITSAGFPMSRPHIARICIRCQNIWTDLVGPTWQNIHCLLKRFFLFWPHHLNCIPLYNDNPMVRKHWWLQFLPKSRPHIAKGFVSDVKTSGNWAS